MRPLDLCERNRSYLWSAESTTRLPFLDYTAVVQNTWLPFDFQWLSIRSPSLKVTFNSFLFFICHEAVIESIMFPVTAQNILMCVYQRGQKLAKSREVPGPSVKWSLSYRFISYAQTYSEWLSPLYTLIRGYSSSITVLFYSWRVHTHSHSCRHDILVHFVLPSHVLCWYQRARMFKKYAKRPGYIGPMIFRFRFTVVRLRSTDFSRFRKSN